MVAEATQRGEEADLILLGPQIRFQLGIIKEMLPDKKIEAIDMSAYGMIDEDKIIKRAKELLQE